MSLYSPASDPDTYGLSAKAQTLDADALELQALVAEQVLGLVGTSYEDDQAEVAKAAVARQINFQLRQAENPDILQEGRGSQSVSYAQVNGQRVAIDPIAAISVRGIKGPPVTSGAVENRIAW